MSNRWLFSVVLDGIYRINKFGQCDAHRQGSWTLNFLNKCVHNIEHLKTQIRKCRWITDEELEECGKEVEACKSEWSKQYPLLGRYTEFRDILKILYRGQSFEYLFYNHFNFAAESDWCNYGYVLDLDSHTLEIYKGKNLSPLSKEDRFYELNRVSEDNFLQLDENCRKHVYYPIKLKSKVRLKYV